jgi:hypothetical protein
MEFIINDNRWLMEIDCGETNKKMAIDGDKPAIEGIHITARKPLQNCGKPASIESQPSFLYVAKGQHQRSNPWDLMKGCIYEQDIRGRTVLYNKNVHTKVIQI